MPSKIEIASASQRKRHKVSEQFTQNFQQADAVILCHSSDVGVMKNLGRNGARFGPEVLLNHLAKMITHVDQKIAHYHLSSQQQQSENYRSSVEADIDAIASVISQNKQIQLGGGHDHIYPLLKAIHKKNNKKVYVINIDAHCDTRVDQIPHSGTPFLRFYKEHPDDLKLIQYGIHHYANDPETLAAIPASIMPILYHQSIHENQEEHKRFQSITQHLPDPSEDFQLVLSLDCDGIRGDQMPAVSAVNPSGLSAQHVEKLLHYLIEHYPRQLHTFGIYEYNPLFDNLGCSAGKYLAQLMYHFLHAGPV
jgi:formiminoglutamase